ncbi:unnamed protein product [Coffea canephora]|uniref:DH200=94 genomic scaffold, scaffold_159 n=1 Tax=Coffea canephora TaxID=49390 RepID=A0A068V9S4_COFCA|nr:unnamed protein product [Coffea canephora]
MTLISSFGEISASRGIERNIFYPETLGQIHFWITFFGVNLTKILPFAFILMSMVPLPVAYAMEQAIPHADLGDLDLDLHLGQPGIEVPRHPEIDWDGLQETLSQNFQLHHFSVPRFPTPPLVEIQEHLFLENRNLPENLRRPLSEAEELLQLKDRIIQTMSRVENNPFWVTNRNSLLGHSLSHTNVFLEYSIDELTRRLNQLETFGRNSVFYSQLKIIEKTYYFFFK